MHCSGERVPEGRVEVSVLLCVISVLCCYCFDKGGGCRK